MCCAVACRVFLNTLNEAPPLVGLLQPGVVIRDPPTATDMRAPHLVLEEAGLHACGWHEQTHWGSEPRTFSPAKQSSIAPLLRHQRTAD